MNAIGSIVVYNGQYYINGMNGIQPVWGVQEFPSDDVCEKNASPENKKKFSQILQETIKELNEAQNGESGSV